MQDLHLKEKKTLCILFIIIIFIAPSHNGSFRRHGNQESEKLTIFFSFSVYLVHCNIFFSCIFCNVLPYIDS